MFSQLVTAIFTPVRSLYHLTASAFEPTPEKQLLQELATAAEQGMVATRSQDHTPRSPKRREGIAVAIEETSSGESSGAPHKRKFDEHGATNGIQENVKRRRSSATSDQLVDSPPAKEEPTKRAEPRKSTNMILQSALPVVPSRKGSEIPNDGIEVRIVTNAHSPRTTSPELDRIAQTEYRSKSTAESPKRKLGQGTKGKSQQDVATAGDSPKSTMSREIDSFDKIAKATHKKFEQDEPMRVSESKASDNAPDAKETIPSPEEERAGSDDEAPETIAASTGLNQAKHAVEEAGKARKIQQAEEKRKRRDRDLRLKIQSKAAKKNTEKDTIDMAIGTESPISPDTLLGSAQTQDSLDHRLVKSPEKQSLPLLLPDELLNAEPVVRPPSPPADFSMARSELSRKRKLLEIDSRSPKDLQRGALKIRVLPDNPGHLPPKPSSKQSKMLRESWLSGQRGPKGGLERRKLQGGFVRAK